MTTVVEIHTAAHIMDLRDLAILHHEEYGGPREFDSAAVCMHGKRVIETADDERLTTAWVAYDADGKPVGYLAATLSQNLYNFRVIAVQQMWYVLPAYRGTRAGVKLVRAYETWAAHHKCEIVFMGVEHDIVTEETARTARLLDRLGFKTRGSYAVKHLG